MATYVFTSAGQLGLGTTNPTSTLHCVGNAFVTGTMTLSNLSVLGSNTTVNSYTTTSSNIVISNTNGFGAALSVSHYNPGTGYPVADFFDTTVSSNVPAFRISNGGKIGVATTSAGSAFSVSGGVSIGTTYAGTLAPTDGLIVSGAVGIGTNNGAAKLTVGGNVGIGSTYVAITPPTDGMLVSGSVGIGTTSPQAVLHVNGAARIDGLIRGIAASGLGNGICPTLQYYRLNTARVGTNTLGAQPIFGVGVSLAANTQYEFESVIAFTKTTGTTAHTLQLGFGGTATVNNIGYSVITNRDDSSSPSSITASSGTVAYNLFISSANNTAVVAVNSLTASTTCVRLWINGTVSINTAGTFIPNYNLTAAPGGAYTTAIGSYFKIWPLAAAGANVSLGTWA